MRRNIRLKSNASEIKIQEVDLHTLLLLELAKSMFKEDLSFRTITELCKNEEVTLREIARRVGVPYSKMSKILQKLINVGVIEYISINKNMRKYRLKKDFESLKRLLI